MSDEIEYEEPDIDTYLRYLKETDPLREQLNLEIIEWLELPQASNGLDIGCGGGTQALMLADAVGPNGHVTGLDIRPEFIKYAKTVAQEKGLSERTSFREGDFNRLPFDNNAFDWVWSSDCIGYEPPTQEIVRVIKPGGSLNLSLWSSEQLLPGYPILEAHLKATSGGIAPFTDRSKPQSHPFRTLAKFKALGLTALKAATFINTVHAPLRAVIRQGITDILEMRWPGVEGELSKDDLDLYKRITDPNSPDFILNLPDYYGFFTYSVFRGWVPK